MKVETLNTVIVGGGQAGIAMSEHLTNSGISHIVLERHRIAERWRSERWDSLVQNGPAWHDRFPKMKFNVDDQHSFVSKDTVVEYFEAYVKEYKIPIRCGVNVNRVSRKTNSLNFTIETSDGVYYAENVVAATGAFQTPVIPPIVPEAANIKQIHSSSYKNPDQLPDGAVLVVGAGSSGAQISDELQRSGRKVYLSMGPTERPPRAYRGHDCVWWLGVLGKWDALPPAEGGRHVAIAVSGAHGGETVDFRKLAARGVTLLGQTTEFNHGRLFVADDLKENMACADRDYLSFLQAADAHVERFGLDLPEEPEAYDLGEDPDCLIHPVQELDLNACDINSIVWATGYAQDFSWLDVDALDTAGRPKHHRGVSDEPGVFFLGLPLQTARKSSFICGVWHDAKFLADQIETRSKYNAYTVESRLPAYT